MIIKRFDSSEGNVWKYVFDFGDAIAESVLYKYESFYNRTVLCVSVQSGCPVGCAFCGTGKKFIRNLTSTEIYLQVVKILDDMNILDVNHASRRFQVMFMSMGEPMLNINNVHSAIIKLHQQYNNAELLISTVGIKDKNAMDVVFGVSKIPKVGLQFSVHEAFEYKRDILIPYENKMSLRELRDFGICWNSITKRPVFINYCVTGGNFSSDEIARLKDLFSPAIFNFTLSVVCSPNESMKTAGYRDLDIINMISKSFVSSGYNVRVFDPAGQDDIGGGCGQLWYVQKWMKEHKIS